MQDRERLAAYLVGELGDDERAALERELATNPDLRHHLEAIRRADEAVAGLPEVTPDPAFSARLRSELRADLRATLPTRAGGGARAGVGGPTDELAARRATRRTPRWVTSLGAAAAGLVFLVAVGVGVTTLAGGADDTGGDTVALESAEVEEETAGRAFGTDEALDAATMAAPGPTVAALGRELDAGSVDDIVTDAAFEVAAEDPDPVTLARRYVDALGLPPAESDGEADTAGGAEEEAAGDAAEAPIPLTIVGEVGEEQLETVRRCLPPLLEGETTRVPVYAELATYEGEPAVVYGLLAADPDTGRLTRAEVWVVAVDACEVRYFTQP